MPFQQIDPVDAIAIPSISQPGPATSGWLSLSQLRTELASLLGGRTDITSSRLNLWVNQAYVDLCGALDTGRMRGSLEITLTPESILYALPSTVRTATRAFFNDPSDSSYGMPLMKIDEEEYRRLPNVDGSGIPTHWCIFPSEVIVIYPAPDLAYVMTLDVKLRPALLTSDSHYPVLDQELVEGLLLLARAKAHSALTEYSLAGQAQNEYVAFIRSRRNEVAEKDEGMIGRMVPVRSQRQFLTSTRGIREWPTREL